MRKEIRFITSNDIGMYVRYDEIDGEEFLLYAKNALAQLKKIDKL